MKKHIPVTIGTLLFVCTVIMLSACGGSTATNTNVNNNIQPNQLQQLLAQLVSQSNGQSLN